MSALRAREVGFEVVFNRSLEGDFPTAFRESLEFYVSGSIASASATAIRKPSRLGEVSESPG
jgi:hypothetical protein